MFHGVILDGDGSLLIPFVVDLDEFWVRGSE